MPTDIRRLLPLRPVDFLLLLALVGNEQHGYGLAGAIAEATDNLVRLEPGNLYRVIKRLVDDGLIAPSSRRPAPDRGRLVLSSVNSQSTLVERTWYPTSRCDRRDRGY